MPFFERRTHYVGRYGVKAEALAPITNGPATAGAAPDELAHLPTSLKLFWALGHLSPYTIIAIIGSQLLLFLTDHVGIAPAVAGTILFVTKLYDAGSDLIIGLLSDRTSTRLGRRRPWMLGGTILIAIATVLMFWIDILPPGQRMTGATVSVLVFYTGYSAFTIPHMAMAAEICRSYQERTSLQVFAMVAVIGAQLLGGSLAPALIVHFGSGAGAFHKMAIVMAVLSFAAGIASVAGTGGAPTIDTAGTVKLAAGEWLRSLVSNQPLLVLSFAKLAHFFAASVAVMIMVYYSIYVLKLGQTGMVVFGSTGTAGGLVGVLLLSRLSKGRRKHRIYAGALIGLGLAFLSYILVPPGNLILFALPTFIFGITASSALLMASSMVADVVEWDYLRFGVRRAGAVTSLMATIQKTTPAISSLAVGALLSWGGYVAGKGTVPQSADTIFAIRMGVTVIPGLFLILAAIPMLLFYRLDEDQLRRAEAAKSQTA